jgi:hypothetical protein
VIPTGEYDAVIYNMSGGGGCGDPLHRPPDRIREDARRKAISLSTAEKMYGVILEPESLEVDARATEAAHDRIKEERLREGQQHRTFEPTPGKWARQLIRFHESLAMFEKEDGSVVTACLVCDRELCPATENYKEYVMYRERDLADVELRYLKNGDRPWVVYQEYACPRCATLLEVDTYCEETDGEDRIVWDIRVDIEKLRSGHHHRESGDGRDRGGVISWQARRR